MSGMGNKGKGQSGDNLKKAIEAFQQPTNRRLLAKNLKSSVKQNKHKNIVAYNPKTNQFLQGNPNSVSKELGISSAVLKGRLTGKKTKFKDIKGYSILSFKDIDGVVGFKNSIVKDTPKQPKMVMDWSPSGVLELEAIIPNYKLKKFATSDNQFWGTSQIDYKISIKDKSLSEQELENIFSDSFSQVKSQQKLKKGDKVRVIIDDPELQNYISTNLMNIEDFTPQAVLSLVEDTIESNQEFQIGPDTNISFVSINLPSGTNSNNATWKGGSSKGIVDTKDKDNKKAIMLANKKVMKASIIQIKNPKDDLCCARAIATAIYRDKYGTASKEYKDICRGTGTQLGQAKKLHRICKVKEGMCGIPEIKKFEEKLGYQITVIDGDFLNEVIYPNIQGEEYKPPDEDSKCIYLFKNGEHFDLIASNKVAGFFNKDNFCHKCKKTFKMKDKHKCIFKCNCCMRSDCPVNDIPFRKRKYTDQCQDCNRFFCHPVCFDNHTQCDAKTGRSVCDKIWKCHTCKKVMLKEIFNPEEHECGDYLCNNCKRVVHKDHKCYMMPKPIKDPNEKYIFFDFEADISDKEHKVMYSVSMYFDDPTPIIHETIEEFCEWAFTKEHKGYTFLAHNGRGYDYKFIIRWVFDNTEWRPFTIFAGQKIMCLSVKELQIRFIDSLCFITKPLKAFPKIFGIPELKKGFFPHWFNTKENWDYQGEIPDKAYFKYDTFKEKDRQEFLVWYGDKVESKYVWNQKREMKEYCISDVDILRRCCMKFRDLYLEIANIDPFQYLTIASVCMSIYKYYYVDCSFPQRYEELCGKWGEYMKGGNPKDVDPQYKIDKEAFEAQTIENVFNEKKIAVFKFLDVEWYRRAFFGGRTNATKLIYNFKEGEEGKYSDITSLYPTVNFYDFYPKGHPIQILEADIKQQQDIRKVEKGEYFGFIDCLVEPPPSLYHPVLPEKGEKLMFDLNPKRGLWCSNEIIVAVKKGYKVKHIYEIRYFNQQTKCLFKDYVKKFLKIKQEASGYPDWCQNENDNDKYISEYLERQGIQLDKEKIVKNPGMREIAKLCLNSLWGKFGQRTNMKQTKIISSQSEFYEIVTNEKYDNINWLELNNNKMEISWSIKDEFVENDFNTNIAIACFTTSSARMRLYKALDYLGEQILYFDTDSCVYKYNPNDPTCKRKLNNGDLLGEWTDELEGKKMLGTFVSGGPKNYSYECHKGKGNDMKKTFHTKVKGFNLNYEVSQDINHYSIIDLVNSKLEDSTDISAMSKKAQKEYNDKHRIEVSYNMIKRTKEHTLSNFVQKKKYGLVYTKRQILPKDEFGNYDTIPFGYAFPQTAEQKELQDPA